MTYTKIIVEQEKSISKIFLNRPDKRNALSPSLLAELLEAAEAVDGNPDCRAIVITGIGEKAFSAGFDISEIKSSGGNAPPGSESVILEEAFARLRKLRTPTIAMINGVVMGAACDLITNCDFRIAVDDAKFAITPAKIGVVYPWEGMLRFVNLIGLANAKEMFMTGKVIPADRALQFGLVNKLVPRNQLWTETLAFAKDLIEGAPLSIIAAKAIINMLVSNTRYDTEIMQQITAEHSFVMQSEDSLEGTRAFLEKRKPVFNGK
jgi:enoyl-CoA hydratase/carnithine racemase